MLFTPFCGRRRTMTFFIVRGTVSLGVWEFESGRFSFFFLPFSKFFFPLVSSFRVRFSVRVRIKVARELVLSLTRLSFPSFFRGFALPFAFHSCTEITRKGKKDSMYSVLSLEFLGDARISRLVVLISPLNCSGN